MRAHTNSRWALWGSIVCALLAPLLAYWPLAVLAIVLAALGGEWPLALLLGILFDLLFGRPPGGAFHMLMFPMTALALLGVIAHRLVRGYVRRNRQEYL